MGNGRNTTPHHSLISSEHNSINSDTLLLIRNRKMKGLRRNEAAMKIWCRYTIALLARA